MKRGIVVVVEDEQEIAHEIASHFMPELAVHFATTLRDARRLIRTSLPRLVAVVFDVQLPDGSGLEALRDLRASSPNTPAMVISRQRSPLIINEANLLKAEYVVKDHWQKNLAQFRASLNGPGQSLLAELSMATRRISERYDLSSRETEVLELSARHLSRETVADQLGVSLNTVRAHIRNILYKSRAKSTQELLRELVSSS